MILIGSRALNLRAPQLLSRSSLDFDWVCTQDEIDKWMATQSHKANPTKTYWLEDGSKFIVEGDVNCEFELIKPGTSTELLAQLVKDDSETIETPFGLIPNLDLLFTIKDSHKFKKFQHSMAGFWKTTIDWHRMNAVGAKVRPEYQPFSDLRKKETYNYKHPSLNQNKDNFFKDDGITYEFDHDDLHKSVAIYDRPAYTYYMKDGAEVQCDKEKFFALSEDIRLAGSCEEGLVLALERSLLCHKGVWTPDYAFKFALAKVSTSITSGWFRASTFQNIFKVLKLYENTSKNYYEKFKLALADGKVKKFINT